MVSTKRIVGVILAGGRSSRMGGGDKCLLPLAGRPVLASVIARLRSQVSDIVINANGEPARFRRLACLSSPTVWQALPGRWPGSMRDLSGSRPTVPGTRYVVTVASDTPFLPRSPCSGF